VPVVRRSGPDVLDHIGLVFTRAGGEDLVEVNEFRQKAEDCLRKVSGRPVIPTVFTLSIECKAKDDNKPQLYDAPLTQFNGWLAHRSALSSKEVREASGPAVIIGADMTERVVRLPPGPGPLSGGIIEFLMKECGGNVCQRQRVHAFTDDPVNAKSPPEAITELTTETSCWQSARPTKDATIGYDFKTNQSIVPTHYTLRSKSPSAPIRPSPPSPKNWAIDVSNDRSPTGSWVNIDWRTENPDLNAWGLAQTFTVQKPPTEAFRFIRLRQTGPHHDTVPPPGTPLALSAFEVFGELRIREPLKI
jgi:hypothetical protein